MATLWIYGDVQYYALSFNILSLLYLFFQFSLKDKNLLDFLSPVGDIYSNKVRNESNIDIDIDNDIDIDMTSLIGLQDLHPELYGRPGSEPGQGERPCHGNYEGRLDR